MAKGPFMEFLRGYLAQTAANAYEELQIPTPASKTENLAMLIHSIELQPDRLLDTVPANSDLVMCHLSRKSDTTVRKLSEPDILASFRAYTSLNAVFNALVLHGAELTKFDPPLLYPKANLYLGLNTVGFTAVTNMVVRIGYTLEKVSREDFISALVE
ncbi:hypothetical protein ES705_42622 [subsurface metagenome]